MNGCSCPDGHERRVVVLTGGPGAGKTAVLEIMRHALCPHVIVLPEAASIVFGGGFPRGTRPGERRAAQRAIFAVQRELEAASAEGGGAIVLCDRGTVDGAAYWPGPGEIWPEMGTTREAELGRYAAVIHMRPPAAAGYDRSNPLRIESPLEAAEIDARIARVWDGHARRRFVDAAGDFLTKARRALALIREELPPCCRRHPVPALGEGPELAPVTNLHT